MSQVTFVNKSQVLIAAATAISAMGFLTVPTPAQADPILPLAPAACSQYGFNEGGFTFVEDNGWQVFLNQTGKNEKTVQGRALTSDKNGANLGGGNINSANINGNAVQIQIAWDNGRLLSYSGTVGDDGIARGQGTDGSWQSIRALPCITAAPAEQPAPVPGRPNDRDSDGLFDADETNVYGTNPDKADTDGDGPDDGQEVFDGTDPLDPNDP
jgi:hypothetical protein